MAVAVSDKGLGGTAFSPRARDLGLGVVHDDALDGFGVHAACGLGAVVVEDLAVLEDLRLELFIRQALHRDAVVEGQHRSGGGALAQDHKHGLHADAAVGDVAGGHGHGHQQIAPLPFLGNQRAVGDLIGALGADADVALVLHIALGGDVTLNVVGVDAVAAHAHAVGSGALFQQLVFRHHIGTDHAAGFADVELMAPVAVVGKFILGQAPGLQLLLHLLGHARVIGHEPHQALLILAVLGDDLAAALVAGLGVVVIVADVVKAERPVVVGVGLVVRDGVKLLEELAPAGVQHAQQDFILAGVVAFRLGKGHAVAGVIGVAGAEAVGLHAFVSSAVFAGRGGAHAGQHAALGISRDLVGADGLLDRAKVVAVVQHADLDAVPLFVIHALCLAAHVVVHTSSCHEVALVGGVDEHLARVGLAAQGGDGGDLLAVFLHALGAVQPLIAHHFEAEFLHVVFKDLLCHMRLKDPHRAVFAIHSGRALAFAAVFGFLLLHPGGVLVVVLPHTVVKVTRETADHGLVARVGKAETAAAQAAEMLVRRDDDDALAHLLGLHGGDDSRAGAAVDDDVVVRSLEGLAGHKKGGDEDAQFHGWRLGVVEPGRFHRCMKGIGKRNVCTACLAPPHTSRRRHIFHGSN